MTQELLAQIDVERRTTRGRACPRCGGKIIPSNRAVYQAANADDSFPMWQCERCGYEEMIAKKTPALKAAPAAGGSSQVAPPKPKVNPPMLDAKGRVLPPDVRAIVSNLGPTEVKDV
jgi:DNA-directed RNA polymerase subunit RPC12/RpoP